MSVSRRRFLQHGALAAAACAGRPLFALGSKHPIGGDEPRELPSHVSSGSGNWQDHAAAFEHLGRASFEKTVGTGFKATLAQGGLPVWLTLVAVEDLPQVAAPNTASFAVPNKSSAVVPVTGFVLRFHSSAEIPQGSYLFQQESLGSFALFTVPEGRMPQSYAAVVNRLENAIIVAVPFAAQPVRNKTQSPVQNTIKTIVPTGATAGTIASPATSSETESLPHGPAGSPGVRRAVVRD